MKKEILLEDLKFISSGIGSYAGKNKLVVDRHNGVIKNIKIIGFISENKRKYSPKTLRAAVPLYEGIKVNFNHPKKPNDPRDAEDRFGKFVNVRFVEGEGIFGDLLFLKSHDMAERVCEAAEREELNDAFGMSHNAQGEGAMTKDGFFDVQKITEVRHVDLVADPATTKSLCESKEGDQQETTEAAYSGVYAASKRRSAKAKRGFVKSKSKGSKKPTGSVREEDKCKDEEDEDEKELKEFMAGLAKIISSGVDESRKVEDLVNLLWESDMSEEIKEGKEEAVKATPETKTVDVTEAKKLEDVLKENASLKAEKKIRELCESSGIKFEADLVEDFAGLNDGAIERQIKRIAAASKAEKPKQPQGGKPENISESKDNLPTGDTLFDWLRN